MKTLIAFAVLAATTFAGCTSTNRPTRSSATAADPIHPGGTDVGTSFPGVNQGVSSPTTATASNESH